MKIVSEKVILPHEVKDLLENLSNNFELSYIEEKTLNYLKTILKIDSKSAKEMYKELLNLNIQELPKSTIIKIIEFLPKDIEDLKIILYGIPIEKEQAEKILDIVKKYI